MSAKPRVWLLLGSRRGDNNQLLALGEALGMPFETRTLHYRRSARLWMKLFPKSLFHLDRASKAWLKPPWPDLVIGIGRRSVAASLWIQRQGGGRARIVRIGHPRADNRLFDLVLATRQYPVPEGDNVVQLPLAMTRFRKPPAPTTDERAWLDRWPRPHLLVLLGGTAPMWRLDMTALDQALRALSQRASAAGGTLLVISSPRTPAEALERVCSVEGAALADGNVRYAVALADADEQFVTADSVSMISEAVLTGKPVGLIAVEPDRRGARILAGDPETTSVRDIRRFWHSVRNAGLVGSVALPRRGTFEDPVALAVRTVLKRLSGLFG